MKKVAALFIVCQVVFAFTHRPGPGAHSSISISSLLNEMTDRSSPSYFPEPSFDLFQASSWDRAELGGKNSPGWFANKDYDNYIRKETNGNRTEYVIMEAHGPGAITKWWFPQLDFLAGRVVRIYLDNNPDPVIAENYKQLIVGHSFVKWPFAFISSDEKDAAFQYSMPVGFPKQVGADFYLPIPFATSCKVTLDDSVFYYNIDYRIYKTGTPVTSFSKADYDDQRKLVTFTGQKLLAPNTTLRTPFSKDATLAKGASIQIELPGGTHAINQICLKMDSREKKQMNRGAVLEVVADGRETIWSPVAEFFGGGVYGRPVKNRNIEVTPDGWMIANWVMPYRKSARVIIRNYGDEAITANLKASVENYQWSDRSMYFHADWHEEAPLTPPKFKDWNYIEIKGKGAYVGDVLTVYSAPRAWWGEGDEKIYINGESFPSQLGTGLEDYYGFAWGLANHFNSPFISMPSRDARGKDNWSGYNTVARMRLLDDIVFTSSLKVDIEAIITQPGVSYAVTCFWYGMDSALSNIQPDTNAVKRKLPDFAAMTLQEIPGKKYPDPARNQPLIGKAKGSISYAGDQLDLLGWTDQNVSKKFDADGDNLLGTAGYIIFGNKIISTYASVLDTASHLPDFIIGVQPQHVISQSGTYLSVPGQEKIMNQTGLIEVSGSIAAKGVVSITVGRNAPSSFRMGVMLDNADSFTKVGNYLWVTDTQHGNSGKVSLAKSNRVPDWYFFDIKGAKEGDKVTIHGSAATDSSTFTIGALIFDISKQ